MNGNGWRLVLGAAGVLFYPVGADLGCTVARIRHRLAVGLLTICHTEGIPDVAVTP